LIADEDRCNPRKLGSGDRLDNFDQLFRVGVFVTALPHHTEIIILKSILNFTFSNGTFSTSYCKTRLSNTKTNHDQKIVKKRRTPFVRHHSDRFKKVKVTPSFAAN